MKAKKRSAEFCEACRLRSIGNSYKKGKKGYKLSKESRSHMSKPRTEEHKKNISKNSPYIGKNRNTSELINKRAIIYSIKARDNRINLTKNKLTNKDIKKIYSLGQKRLKYIEIHGIHYRPYPIMTFNEIAAEYNCSLCFVLQVTHKKAKTEITKNI